MELVSRDGRYIGPETCIDCFAINFITNRSILIDPIYMGLL